MILGFLLAARLACDPRLTALFTPSHPTAGTYKVCTTSEPIGSLRARASDPTVDSVEPAQPGQGHYGPIQLLSPLDAFGAAGPFDRAALWRLYGGMRPQVVRGWVERERASSVDAFTLISPYPNATMSTLEPGTMVIVLTLTR